MTLRVCEGCGQPIPVVEGLVVDTARGDVRYLDKVIHLTGDQMRIFADLAEKPGRVRTKERLLYAISFDAPECDEPEIKVIDVQICKLRAQLEGSGLEIKTHRGVGFELLIPGVESKTQTYAPGPADVAALTYGAK